MSKNIRMRRQNDRSSHFLKTISRIILMSMHHEYYSCFLETKSITH